MLVLLLLVFANYIMFTALKLYIHIDSVTMIEGTITSLLENNGTIVEVEYKKKFSDAKAGHLTIH